MIYRGGRAYLFHGRKIFKKELDASDAELIIKADSDDEWVGNKVIIIPDINGDKLSDFVISAPGKTDEKMASGIACVFYGGKRIGEIRASEADLHLKGRPVGRKFGSDIAVMGDINGDGNVDLAIRDGKKEVVICSYYDDSNGEKSGTVFIYRLVVKKTD